MPLSNATVSRKGDDCSAGGREHLQIHLQIPPASDWSITLDAAQL